ncbi:biphenyl-2,3-diol 1,2-dioxygenase [Phenylobacterium sp. LjRoot164]|uniref:biphenyl-2,3-diol 1,2-dioxygenase n=1 Tax=unclassified Phenylobacterium TaxID=2640670 RepID=UPI003ED09AF7
MSIASLGYVGFKADDLEAWARFGTETLGMMQVEAPEGSLRFRIDAQGWRVSVEQGPENDIAYIGFEVTGAADLEAMAARLSGAGVAYERGAEELLKLRGVMGMIACTDPQGLAVEIYYGPTQRGEVPFVSPAGVTGFVTGEQGLGHVVLSAADIAANRKFYSEVLGFRLSDIIRMQITEEFGMDLEFYHCNPRHHTLALVPLPVPRRLNHFMLQVASLDDVGFALDRINAANIPLTNTLGKHTNDHMVSFYAQTPSGFEIEYGWGARDIDENWRVVRHDKTSIWGHKRQH